MRRLTAAGAKAPTSQPTGAMGSGRIRPLLPRVGDSAKP